jgi:hypothetical protein
MKIQVPLRGCSGIRDVKAEQMASGGLAVGAESWILKGTHENETLKQEEFTSHC